MRLTTISQQPQSQTKMKMKNRRAISGLLEMVLLVGVSTVVIGIIAVGVNSLEFDKLSCEIQMFEVYKIKNDNYFAEITIYNNGDYMFNWDLLNLGDVEITEIGYNLSTELRPFQNKTLDFQFIGNDNMKSVTMGFDVNATDQTFTCLKEAKIWINYYNMSW